MREGVGVVGRDERPHLNDDLRMPAHRNRAQRARPRTPVDKRHDRPNGSAREPNQIVAAERLIPGVEQLSERMSLTRSHENRARRIDGDQRAETAGGGHPPIEQPLRTADTDARWHEHDPVGGKDLDMDTETRTQSMPANPGHRPPCRRVKARTQADRPCLGEQRP